MTNQPRFFGKSILRAQEVDWEAAYQADLPRIYNFFRYRVADDSLSEDLTAETFEKAWRNRQRYRHDLAAFSTWLFTIAQHVAIDYFRKPHPEVSLETVVQAAGGETVESMVQQRSDFERLSSLLARLPEREHELVALKYGAGLTNRMVARLTGMSESNVGTILQRVTRQLRADWEQNHES
jgi:RNA polymerase sigma-70 factor (ECF subfamily)